LETVDEMKDVKPRSHSDVLAELLGTVRQAMTTAVLTLPPDMRICDAMALLRRHGVGGAPVLDAGRLIGVVTQADLFAHTPKGQGSAPFPRPDNGGQDWCVRDVMNARGPSVACVDEPLTEAVVRMDERGVDRMPVVDPRLQTVGILSRGDVVRTLARAVRRLRLAPDGPPPVLLAD
jgi:CBS domain-containing protein